MNNNHLQNQHLANMDLLRGLAVLSVVAHHTRAVSEFSIPFVAEYGGLLGVQLFFLISGYLITASASQSSLPHYFVHRFFRIFPAYWLVYIAFGLYSGVFFRHEPNWWAMLMNLLNLQQLLPQALLGYDVISVSWTLTVELFWYLLAPFFVFSGKRWALWWLAASVVVSSAWSYLASKGWFHPYYASSFEALRQPADAGQVSIIINNHFLAQMVFFIFGGTIYYYKDFFFKISDTILNAVIFFFVFLISLYLDKFPSPFFVSSIGLAALMIKILRAPASNEKILSYLGKISYSVYLIHFPIIIFCMHKLAPSMGLYAIALAYVLIAAIGSAIYYLVEKPCVRLGKRLTQGTTQRRPRSASSVPVRTTGQGAAGTIT